MKLKYYFRGLGAGILFTALVFSFIIMPKQEPMTDEEVIARAKELGLTEQQQSGLDLDAAKRTPTPLPGASNTPAPTDKPEATPTTTQAPTKAPTATPTTAPTLAPTKTPTTAPTSTPTKAPTSTPTTAPTLAPTKAPTPTRQAEAEVTVEVLRGMTSEEFASAVKKAGVITDSADFNRYLIINDYADHIRIGKYKMWKGMTYLEIAEKVAGYN